MARYHRTSRKSLAPFLATFCASLLTLSPVWADDTEIFFGDFNDSEVSPNVLFIVDTSGSMNNTVAGTGMTRMQNVQVALRTLLNNLNDVNVGMMRFSNPGGPVLYPVDYIDRNVNLSESGDALVTAAISDAADDVQELDIGFFNVVIDNRERLEMSRIVAGAITTTAQVSSSEDDAEEQIYDDRCSITGSPSLEMTHDDDSTENQAVGVRFTGLDIPANAIVTDAYITFVVRTVDAGGLAEVRISGETRDTGEFDDRGGTCSTGELDNISGRDHTTEFVDWDLDQNYAAEEFLNTPDLTDVVQEIIGDTNWVGDGSSEESDMVFMFELRPLTTATGRYDFYAWDEDTDKAPSITIEYYIDGSPPAEVDAITGLRFQSVNIPQGATITSATLDFTAAQGGSEATDIVIEGILEPSADTFDAGTAGGVSLRARTTASVDWTAVEEWTQADLTYSSPDISNVVEEIVGQAGWCGGNDLAFVLSGTGLRSAYAREAANGYQPVLSIEYDPESIDAGNSCAVATINKGIVSSSDDVEEDGSNALLNGNVLDFEGSNKVGMRFTEINIPKDATIISAYIQVTSDANDTGSADIDIRAEEIDDADTFTSSDGTVEDRDWSSAVTWSPVPDWDDNASQVSTDIGALVQDTVERDGWVLGNDMAFLLDHSSGSNRRGITYDNDPVNAPRLIINFQDDGAASIDARLVRDELLEVVDSLNTQGYTPVQDTLYEAALYYTGRNAEWGKQRGGPNDGGPHAYTRVSAAASMVPGTFAFDRPTGCSEDDLGDSDCAGETITGDATYETPIVDWCQATNHIIMLTDGQANRPHSETLIEDFIEDEFEQPGYTCDVEAGVSSSEICVKDLARFMYEEDVSDLRDNQRIVTHTIGFNFSSQWLEDVATAGGGQYREAQDAADLVGEIEQILAEVLKTNTSFVAPVAAINQFNRLNHRNEIYFAVFRPDERPSWPGNLKKYRLRTTDNVVIDYTSDDELDSLVAVSTDTGFFNDGARSDWTTNADAPDGRAVDQGGAASAVPAYGSRNVYTYYPGSTSINLSNTVNVVATTNNNLTKAMFGVSSFTDAEFEEHLEWVLGRDTEDEDDDSVTNENRYVVGDPLHSKPVAITYGGTEEEPDISIFFGTNAGLLHAIDAATGEEQFAFLPVELMGMQNTLRQNETAATHPYGVDGSITPWVRDVDADGVIEAADGDFVRLFFGLRRGGNKYYALDVTDRDNPEWMWEIVGGSGDFAELGQTWSRPVAGEILVESTEMDVLFFAGGYDTDQDDATTRQTDDIGRAIFIVDAATGDLVWSGGPSNSFTQEFTDMQYSIPSDLSVAVVQDEDEYDDLIFVGDMGGQLWRFDINNGETAENLITGGVIGDLGVAGGTNTEADNRRFYHAPDIALIQNPDGNPAQLMIVTIGSGFRASPLSTGTENRFFMIEQQDIYQKPTSYAKLTVSNLYNATDNDVGEGVEGAEAALASQQGWYFNLPNTGEKVLSTPLTFRNTVTFTTYQPSPNAVASRCIPAAGVSRFYQVNVLDSSPVNEWNDITGLTEGDRSTYLQSASIVDEPVIVCTGTGCDIFAGAEQPDVDTGSSSRIVKTFWRMDN